MSHTSPAIILDDISISHAGTDEPTLSHANAMIEEGDLALVVGRTGTGKSTLLSVLNGLM